MFKFLNKKILIILTAGVLIILLHYVGALRLVENYVITFLKPVERIVFRSGNKIQQFYGGKADITDLADINEELEEANRELLAENIRLKVLEDENKALREQLKFYSQHSYRKVLANVISRGDSLGINQTIVIDKGEKDGVRINQAIIAGNGIMVGKIFTVKESISYSYLVTDERCQIAAVVVGKEETNSLTKGELGLIIQMDFIPQTESINPNDTIITSGLEQAIPRGLIIGNVQEIKKETNNLFQSAVINPAVDIHSLSIVSVIID